jgi:hypothetical protein
MVGKNKDKDIFKNHMTVEQNEKFALLCDAILNNKEPDTSWFAQHTNSGTHFFYE